MKFVRTYQVVKMNAPGGIFPISTLQKLLSALSLLQIGKIKFGLRQNIFIEFPTIHTAMFEKAMQNAGLDFQQDINQEPNVMSSYPAQNIFPANPWLSEEILKGILDAMDYRPSLKINITDNMQTLTPVFTGNINWIASEGHPQYWHLFIRFPKTNSIIQWKHMIHTDELMPFSKSIETLLIQYKGEPLDQLESLLLQGVSVKQWNAIPDDEIIQWQPYSLPYYEGLNKYKEHYWLGIYRRDEWFETAFLKDLCTLCEETHISEISITPWKSIIIKSILDADRPKWNHLLNVHHINVRHGLNELNFQVEDHNPASLKLKQFIVNNLNEDDIRTQGICFGIKSRPKTEVFSNILIRKRHLIQLGRIKAMPVYDILLAKDFNPNERTGMVYRKSLFSYLLPMEIQACIKAYYNNRIRMADSPVDTEAALVETESLIEDSTPDWVYQCSNCKSVIMESNDPISGEQVCASCGAYGEKIIQVPRSSVQH